MILVAVIPVLALGLLFFLWPIHALAKALGSRNWPTTHGTIEHARASHIFRGGGAVDVLYKYSVDGKEYQGSRMHFGMGQGYSSLEVAREHIRNYHPHGGVKVHYHPKKPDVSVLEPGMDWLSRISCVISIFGGLVLIAAALGMFTLDR